MLVADWLQKTAQCAHPIESYLAPRARYFDVLTSATVRYHFTSANPGHPKAQAHCKLANTISKQSTLHSHIKSENEFNTYM